MGAGSSIGVAEKQVANDVLNEILGNTDMATLVRFTDTKGCSELSLHIQQYLLRTTKDTIHPIPPARPMSSPPTFEEREREKQRISACFNYAHILSKVIQTYAAVAMNLFIVTVGKQTPKGGRRTRRNQRGGAITSTAEGKLILNSILGGLILFSNVDSKINEVKSLNMTINITSGTYIFFTVKNPRDLADATSLRFDADVYYRDKLNGTCALTFEKNSETGAIEFAVNGVTILFFHRSPNERWSYSTDGTYENRTDLRTTTKIAVPNSILAKIKAAINLELVSTTGPTVGVTPSFAGQAQSSSDFFPPAVKEIKDLLAGIKEAKKPLPQPLAFARARILMNPIDPAERTGTTPVLTQICLKEYNFEGSEYVPKKGMSLKATPYFKSLLNLYYDSFRMNYTTQKYEWTLSAEAEQQLKIASNDLAILYTNKDDVNFLIESKALPGFDTICKDVNREFRINTTPALLSQIEGTVKKLLDLQEEYIKQGNTIVKGLFSFSANGISFHPEIFKEGGLEKIKEIIKYTRAVILNYYMKVESLYIQGVISLEQAKKQGLLVEY
jgi:hypothetical protein